MSEYLFPSECDMSEPYLRYLPVMITRLLLSLRKANDAQEYEWSLGESTTDTMKFARHRGTLATNDEIRLDTFASTYEGAQSRA